MPALGLLHPKSDIKNVPKTVVNRLLTNRYGNECSVVRASAGNKIFQAWTSDQCHRGLWCWLHLRFLLSKHRPDLEYLPTTEEDQFQAMA